MRNKFITIISCVLLVLFLACIAGGFIIVLKYRKPEREEYDVIVSDEINIYAGEQITLAPYLINKSGKNVQARFEYSSSDAAVKVSDDGVISVVGTPENDAYVTVTDKKTSATTTVKVKLVDELKTVFGLVIVDSEGNRTAYTGAQKLELESGKNVKIEVITLGGIFEIKDLTTLTAVDEAGTAKNVFDCNYDKNEVTLTAIGLGAGQLRFQIADGQNTLLNKSIGFEILMPNTELGKDILQSANATLLSPSEIESIKAVTVSVEQVDLAELSGLKSLNTVAFTAESVVKGVNLSDKYNYFFKSELLEDYVSSAVWSKHKDRLFPYDGQYAEEDAYVVLHNNEPSDDCPKLDYIKVTPKAQLPVYGKTGRIVSGWVDCDGNSYDNEQLRSLPAPGVHLNAVWMDTPTEWFSYETIDGKLYITALTEEWENCSDVLDKSCLYLPDSYNGQDIYGIGEGAFKDNQEIRRVLVPSTIENIADDAFNGCNKLVEVLGAENIAYVGRDAFTDTVWLNGFNEENTFLVLGKVAMKYVASGTVTLSEADFPEKVTAIGHGAFKGCGATGGSIVIPKRIKAIYDEAFANSGITDYTMQNGITFGKKIFRGVTVNTFTIRGSHFDFTDVADETDVLSINTMKFVFDATSVDIRAQSNVTVGTVAASGLSFNVVTFTGFKSIETLNLYNNNLSGVNLAGSSIGTLNLTNNELTSLNLNNIHATRLMLAGNSLTSITCTTRNEAVKIIYMPSDGAQNKNKITSLAFTANTPNLMSLDVANNNISNISGLETLTNLRELYLGGNSVLGNSTQMSKLNKADFCSKLVRLNLGGNSSNTTVILTIVEKCTNLEWLQIYGIGASSTQITNAIKQSTHSKLKYLKISHNGFTSVPGTLKYINKVVIDYNDKAQD